MKSIFLYCVLAFSFGRILIPLNSESEKKLRELGYNPQSSWLQVSHADDTTEIPQEYDLRTTNYSKCIHAIADEGKCQGSWALISTSVLSDRYCMRNNKTPDIILSGQDLLNCDTQGKGCQGGEAGRIAFEYLNTNGVCLEECQPWVSTDGNVRECKKSCEKGSYKAYTCKQITFEIGDDDIKKEILKNGPVDCRFELYEDFNDYKSGIYYRVANKRLNPNHAAKVVGWSVENQIKFWILANSWGPKWGENGYFRIKEGEAGICKIGVSCEPGPN